MNEFNNENQEQNIENQPTEPVVEQPTEPVAEQPTEPVAEQPAEPVTEQPTEPVVEQPTEPPVDNTYNSQYTYHNVNPQPQNYYGAQKHYIPTGFNNGYPTRPVAPQPVPQPTKPNNHKKGLKVFVAILLAVTLFVGGAALGRFTNGTQNGGIISNEKDDSLKYQGEDLDVNSGNKVERGDIKPDENGRYTADQVAQLVNPSVVNIQVYSKTDSSAGATASGVILNDKGYIITNDHIYSEVTNAKFIITMSNGESYKASYVAGDQRSDIAVLKFDDLPKDLQSASFADSSTVKPGDDVIAIGSPYGLSGTVTKGIVSYPSRRITTSTTDANGQPTASYSMRVIQTDVALNSGNSGGALVNMYGQVVGINSSKIAISGYEGLCFAIPANDAIKYAKSLVKNGVVANRARLGITYTTITSATSLVNEVPAGLLIQNIDEKSELYTKGLVTGQNGDIITEIHGKKITSSDIALDVIDDSNAGDEVTLKVYIRATKITKTFKIKLLEDTSNTSYVNEIPKPSTTTGGNYYGGNQTPDEHYDGNDGDKNDDYSYFEDYFDFPFEFGQ